MSEDTFEYMKIDNLKHEDIIIHLCAYVVPDKAMPTHKDDQLPGQLLEQYNRQYQLGGGAHPQLQGGQKAGE